MYPWKMEEESGVPLNYYPVLLYETGMQIYLFIKRESNAAMRVALDSFYCDKETTKHVPVLNDTVCTYCMLCGWRS